VALAESAIHGSEKEAAACLGISHQRVKQLIHGVHCRLGTTNIAQALIHVGWVVIPGSVGISIHE
jgi:DNA-binding CsgD family transcriptional regulator